MTILNEIQTTIRQHAEGADFLMVSIGHRWGVGLPDTQGLLIQQVTEDSPAARVGLSSGDLIVAAADQPAGGVDDLFDALQGAQSGTLELRVVRGIDERTVQVVFTPEIEGK
jgi:S1-C subfamily serine protease